MSQRVSLQVALEDEDNHPGWSQTFEEHSTAVQLEKIKECAYFQLVITHLQNS